MMLEYKVRGILYSTWFHRATDIPASLRESDFVLVNCFSKEPGNRAVVPMKYKAAVSHEIVLKHGHRRIAFINATIPAPAKDGRLQGYKEALEAEGIPFDAGLVLEAYPDQEGGNGATEELLSRDVTAVYRYKDRMAMGLYDGLREHGLCIPDDMAVVGFDNQESSQPTSGPPFPRYPSRTTNLVQPE